MLDKKLGAREGKKINGLEAVNLLFRWVFFVSFLVLYLCVILKNHANPLCQYSFFLSRNSKLYSSK